MWNLFGGQSHRSSRLQQVQACFLLLLSCSLSKFHQAIGSYGECYQVSILPHRDTRLDRIDECEDLRNSSKSRAWGFAGERTYRVGDQGVGRYSETLEYRRSLGGDNFTLNRALLQSYVGDHKAALKGLQEAIPVFTEMAENGAKAEVLLAKCLAENLRFSVEAKKHNIGAPGSALRKTDLLTLYLHIADAQKKLEDWEAAMKTYTYIFENFKVRSEMTAQQQLQTFVGGQECAYEMKDYRYAMQLGDTVMKTNRFRPGIHKSTALAYRAIGKVEEARFLAARAIMYEAPWDEENKKKNWKFWKEYNEENIASPEIKAFHAKHCFVSQY